MPDKRLIQVSKLMSLILRHEPDQFGLVLDPEGFVAIDDLIGALRKRFADVSIADVRGVVESIEPDKSRFTIVGTEIRANYGHSLSQRIQQESVEPPGILLHGTNEAAADSIRREGIRPMGRQYVHLTVNRNLAIKVATRHGRPCVLEVNATLASRAGVAFYRANESFWLADFVPPDFIR